MTTIEPTPEAPDEGPVRVTAIELTSEMAEAEGFEAKIFRAISVQRPVVLEYLKSVRRDKPDATPAEILKELEKRYVSTVTLASAGVGASAAIPAVGVPLALGLGVADLLFFYETSALYVLAATELHGIEVHDAERARPLVVGILLGQKSQSKVAKVVFQAAGAGGIDTARTKALGAVGSALPDGWGTVVTQQLPDAALAPVATVLAREALKASTKLGAGTLGKAIPFGIGAVVGGTASFTFGRDVVKAAHVALPTTPHGFPESLRDFHKPEPLVVESSRAARALQSASGSVTQLRESIWGKANDPTDTIHSGEVNAYGEREQPRALTAAKHAGSAVKNTAVDGASAVGSRLKRKRGK